jgi:acyl dehydratase
MTTEPTEIDLRSETYNRSITAEMLAREHKRVGQRYRRGQPHFEVATKDAIRLWARGIGDRNPLYVDEEYAKRSVHGGLVGSPTMVQALDHNLIGSAARGFPGFHGWHLGNSFEWFDVIRHGVSFRGETWIESLKEVKSSYSGVGYDQDVETHLSDSVSGELACTAHTYIRRWDREAGRKSTKYSGRTKQTYTPKEIATFADAYASEEIRGAEPRYIDDVAVGGKLPQIIRGPLTIMDCIAFVIGWGGSFIFAHGYAYEFLRKHPGAFPLNESGVPDSPERTHWVDAFAQAVGAPAAFDYGPQRIAWCGTLITNWMGDAGFLRRLKVRILRPNYHGDVVYLDGTITAVRAAESEVDITLVGVNQLGETVVDADSTVRLPTR